MTSRRTKIVATLGPATETPEIIDRLFENGVNIFRLNFSHGDHSSHRQIVRNIRELASVNKEHIAIMGDLQGPKIRIGDVFNGSLLLKQDDTIVLTTQKPHHQLSTKNAIHVEFEPLPQCVQTGDILLIDDGLIRVVVESSTHHDVCCRVIMGGELKSKKGLNRFGGGLSAPAITEKDYQDIALAAELHLDYLAVSFPCCADDLDPIKNQLQILHYRPGIIAKIERAEAVANDQVLTELIIAADGVMVARGDLGVEIGDAQLMGVQKKIIRYAQQLNRPVITATQMMESMTHSPIPTRAEVFDVANAVLDGTDAVMLSAETATGQYPVQAVAAMADACLGAEKHPVTQRANYRLDQNFEHIEETIAMSAIYAANQLNDIGATICITESGKTALLMSRVKSGLPIYAISRHQATCRRMALYRGVIPIWRDLTKTTENVYQGALDTVVQAGHLMPGQRVTITSGDITGAGNTTNTLKILEYRG